MLVGRILTAILFGPNPWVRGALPMSGMACPVGMLVVAGFVLTPSVKAKSNRNTNRDACPYAYSDVAYCCTNTGTDGHSDAKCKGQRVIGCTHFGFLVARLLFHCIYSFKRNTRERNFKLVLPPHPLRCRGTPR